MNFAVILVAYLVGSLPFALWLARRRKGADVRRSGSGNLGTTNVWRVAGTSTALAVLVLDMGKGLGAVWFARALGSDVPTQAAAAAAVVIGHVFPLWLKFRGGKGVATSAGAFSILTPWVVLVAAGVFVTVVWMSRFVSVGSLVAAVSLVPLALIDGAPPAILTSLCAVTLLVVTRHRSNITRLLAGNERRLGQRA